MTYITLANMYNSELAELFLRFKEKDEILVGRAVEAVPLAFAVQIIRSSYECPLPLV